MNGDELKGKQILITRAKHQAKEMSDLIARYGGTAVTLPILDFKPVTLHTKEEWVLEKLDRYQWAIFTSSNAVSFFKQLLETRRKFLPKSVSIAVIGKKTAKKVKDILGRDVDFIPKLATSEGLAQAFKEKEIDSQTILIPQGQLAKPDLKLSLEEQGHQVTPLTVYETVCHEEGAAQLKELVTHGQIDVVTFTSPSSIQFFIQSLDEVSLEQVKTHWVIACIGSVTADAARALGFTPHIIPKEYSVTPFVQEIVTYFKEESTCQH